MHSKCSINCRFRHISRKRIIIFGRISPIDGLVHFTFKIFSAVFFLQANQLASTLEPLIGASRMLFPFFFSDSASKTTSSPPWLFDDWCDLKKRRNATYVCFFSDCLFFKLTHFSVRYAQPMNGSLFSFVSSL